LRGQWVWIRDAGGAGTPVVGVKESEVSGTIQLRQPGGVAAIPRSTVLEVEDDDVDARDVWSTAQLMERFERALSERNPPQALRSPQGRVAFRVGEFAEWAGALEDARDAFRRAAADPAFDDRAFAERRARRIAALLEAPGAPPWLENQREHVGHGEFGAARRLLADYVEQHAELSEEARAALADVQAEADARRDRVLAHVARHDFPAICRRLIEARVKEKAVGLEDARAWAKKDLANAAFAELARRIARWDTVDPRPSWEARWDETGRGAWQRVSYGSGTFLAHPANVLPARVPAPANLPVPPTPEQWWRMHAVERAPWLMASFVETSGLFEVAEALHQDPCVGCLGEGIKEKRAQTGAVITFLCDRCAGTRFDYAVRFR
jgi:hypothetical protein